MTPTTPEIEKLIEINDELENYFKNTIIPQLFVDAEMVLQKFTPPAMKQFSLSLGDVGKTVFEIIDNFRYPSIAENIRHVIDTGEILEKEIQTTDGGWYQMNILPYVVQKSKKTNGVIITFVEITKRIKDLKEQERLIAENELLLDTISHDIKTPLTNLVLLVDLFKTVSPENAEDYTNLVGMVENAVTRMQLLINELTSTRMESYKYKADEELLDFEDILGDVRLTIADNIKESGATIRTDIQVTEVTFSRRKLRSVLYNLLNNAIKFKSADRVPEIFVSTQPAGDFTLITVKDNGVGVAPDKLDEIFSKYFRLDHTPHGSGLGLYLVKEVVKNAGGRVLVESEPGKGSEFKVYIKA